MQTKYFQTDGTEYDAFVQCIPHHEAFQKLIASTLVDRLGNVSRPRILEIGCGTGLTTEKILAAHASCQIVAIDNDASMLAVARERLAPLAPNVELQEMDAFAIAKKFDWQSFDAVVSAYCIHNHPPVSRMNLYMAIGGVLAKGGVLVIGDKIGSDSSRKHWQELRKAIDGFSKLRGTKFAYLEELWVNHYLQDEGIRLTEAEQRQLFRAAWCDEVQLAKRWGIDVVMSARRISW